MKEKRTYADIKKDKKEMERIIAENYPKIKDECGIYMFYRVVAYIGKSAEKDGILGRCASHCLSFEQHIDKSIHTRKLSCDGGQWFIKPLIYCSSQEVDKYERELIEKYNGIYELLNKENGGTNGKTLIQKRKEPKGYRDGLKQGYINAQREVAHWFDKSLDFSIKGKENVNKLKAKARFEEFLKKK